jgi:hypothetical protein
MKEWISISENSKIWNGMKLSMEKMVSYSRCAGISF